MKIVLLGDVGSAGGYHAGDEAMAEAVADELASRGPVEVTAISGDEADTAARYGWQTVPRIGFAGLASDDDRDRRLQSVLDAAAGEVTALDWDDPAWKVVHAVSAADAVVISGGGNLSSTWPEHVYERAALAALAAAFATPHVVTGQTLGPHLTARHGELVGRIVTSAALIAAREQPSYEIALRLGTAPERLARVIDDASYLRGTEGLELPAGPYVAATFAPPSGLLDTDEFVGAVARLMDEVARAGSLRFVLIPHHATVTEAGSTGDLVIHEAIARAVEVADVEVLPPITARDAVRITQGAKLVLSTRYHPVVFAVAGGVPAIGIGVDAYTTTKIHGALDNYGLGALALSIGSLVRDELVPVVVETLARDAEIRAHLEKVGAVREAEHRLLWDAVNSALQGDPAVPVEFAQVPAVDDGTWFPTAIALRDWSTRLSGQYEAERLESLSRLSDAERLQDEVDGLERERAELSADLAHARDEIDALRVAVESAYALVSDPLKPLAGWLDTRPSVDALRAELDAVYATKTFRYLEKPRQVYRRLRMR